MHKHTNTHTHALTQSDMHKHTLTNIFTPTHPQIHTETHTLTHNSALFFRAVLSYLLSLRAV